MPEFDWKAIIPSIIATIITAILLYAGNRLLEKVRYEQQRKLINFKVYTTKKHDQYILLYEALTSAQGYISQLTAPLKARRDYTDYTLEEIEEHFSNDLKISRSEVARILELRSTHPDLATDTIYRWVNRKEEYDTEVKINELRKAFYSAQLYLSPKLMHGIEDVIEQMISIRVECNSDLNEQLDRKEKVALLREQREKAKEVSTKVSEIVQTIRNELSVGYYTQS